MKYTKNAIKVETKINLNKQFYKWTFRKMEMEVNLTKYQNQFIFYFYYLKLFFQFCIKNKNKFKNLKLIYNLMGS